MLPFLPLDVVVVLALALSFVYRDFSRAHFSGDVNGWMAATLRQTSRLTEGKHKRCYIVTVMLGLVDDRRVVRMDFGSSPASGTTILADWVDCKWRLNSTYIRNSRWKWKITQNRQREHDNSEQWCRMSWVRHLELMRRIWVCDDCWPFSSHIPGHIIKIKCRK